MGPRAQATLSFSVPRSEFTSIYENLKYFLLGSDFGPLIGQLPESSPRPCTLGLFSVGLTQAEPDLAAFNRQQLKCEEHDNQTVSAKQNTKQIERRRE